MTGLVGGGRRNEEKNDIASPVKIIWNGIFSIHKSSFVGTPPRPRAHVWSPVAFCYNSTAATEPTWHLAAWCIRNYNSTAPGVPRLITYQDTSFYFLLPAILKTSKYGVRESRRVNQRQWGSNSVVAEDDFADHCRPQNPTIYLLVFIFIY